MPRWNTFVQCALLTGLAVSGAAKLSAQDWDDRYYQRQDLRRDYRDLGGDYVRVNAMHADIARDRARLNADIRRGRQDAAARDAADLARDQRALDAQLRDIRRDQRDIHHDQRDQYRDSYRDSR
jgi:hypothetical protein